MADRERLSSWWIDEPRVLGTSNPTLSELKQLRSDGFSILVSLLHEDEQPPKYEPARAEALGFQRFNIPVKDFQPPTLDQLAEFVALMDRDGAVRSVVHCAGGIGRTGTFAVAYWISRGMRAEDAVALVRRARPGAVETQEQMMALVDFERSNG